MSWAKSIRRQPHKVTLDGNSFFVRALTRAEIKRIDALDIDNKENEVLRCGVCDENGLPVLRSDDISDDVPVSIVAGLIDKIYEVSRPDLKKDSAETNDSSGK